MRLTAKMSDGATRTIEAETAGDVYEALGAECVGTKAMARSIRTPWLPTYSTGTTATGSWWATRDAMEGEHDEIEGSDESALAQVIAAE